MYLYRLGFLGGSWAQQAFDRVYTLLGSAVEKCHWYPDYMFVNEVLLPKIVLPPFCTVLVQNLNKAVQDILQHFGRVRQEAEKVAV